MIKCNIRFNLDVQNNRGIRSQDNNYIINYVVELAKEDKFFRKFPIIRSDQQLTYIKLVDYVKNMHFFKILFLQYMLWLAFMIRSS